MSEVILALAAVTALPVGLSAAVTITLAIGVVAVVPVEVLSSGENAWRSGGGADLGGPMPLVWTLREVKTRRMAEVAALRELVEAFNAHDLDRIMRFFSDDCVLDMPRGTDPGGARYSGRAAVREGLASRFAGIPDVHYGDDEHWICGDHAVSRWLLTGTSTTGEKVRVRGCDLFDLAPDGRIRRKDSYWKIVM